MILQNLMRCDVVSHNLKVSGHIESTNGLHHVATSICFELNLNLQPDIILQRVSQSEMGKRLNKLKLERERVEALAQQSQVDFTMLCKWFHDTFPEAFTNKK